jgi:hypothetical protein
MLSNFTRKNNAGPARLFQHWLLGRDACVRVRGRPFP